jgi:BirA family biotin operon repressor/biotin-[acetyl-CoA-carboxylase] ligase
MDVAWSLAQTGAGHGTSIICMDQVGGRGRFGRSWVSAPGRSLALSVILRPEAAESKLLSIVGGLAVVKAISQTTGVQATIKWPNDVRIDGKKVCGVLTELQVDTDGMTIGVIGVGLNLSLDVSRYPELRDSAVSLRFATGHDLGMLAAAEAVLAALDDSYSRAVPGGEVVAAWRDTLDTLGQRIIVHGQGMEEAGVAEDVAPDGSLLLRRDDGSLVRLSSGEVTLQSPV